VQVPFHPATTDVFQRDDLPFPHSLPEFQRLFPEDRACAAYLERARWRNGFVCPCDILFGLDNRSEGLTGNVLKFAAMGFYNRANLICAERNEAPFMQIMGKWVRHGGRTGRGFLNRRAANFAQSCQSSIQEVFVIVDLKPKVGLQGPARIPESGLCLPRILE
jgi:hypothetical protein